MNWIKIGKGHAKPAIGEKVLCTIKFRGTLYVVQCKYFGTGFDPQFLPTEEWFRDIEYSNLTNSGPPEIIAWMPLPKPYVESLP